MLPKLDAPIYETKLISDGRTIKFRPFLVKEQKILMMASESNEVKDVINAIKQILSNCILTKDVKIDELPTFDLEHLFLQLRIRSVGEISTLKFICNNKVMKENGEEKRCEGKVEIKINLLDIKPEKKTEHTNKIQLTDNLGVVMKYPNFNLIDKLDSNNVDSLDMLINCIDYIYDKENIYYAKETPKDELIEFVESMQQNDLEKIQQFFLTMPKIEKDLDFKCPKCGYHENMHVEGIQNFFE